MPESYWLLAAKKQQQKTAQSDGKNILHHLTSIIDPYLLQLTLRLQQK